MKRFRPLLWLAIAGMAAYLLMFLQAQVVHIEYADVYLKDLPQELDGTKLLYVSDIHISSAGDAAAMEKLMDRLQESQPDMLLLGGDYSDVRLWDQLRCLGNKDKLTTLKQNAYSLSHEWLKSLADFNAPMGKFAVQGNHDASDLFLSMAMEQGGIRLLMNSSAAAEKNGARLVIAGVGDYTHGTYEPYLTAENVQAGDCCILLSHNPDALPQMFTIDAADGGGWIDLALSGHTHGGQVRFGNFVPITNSNYGLNYLTGWHEQLSGHSLTSNGVGTTALPIRFGAPAQVHIITLHRSLPVE